MSPDQKKQSSADPEKSTKPNTSIAASSSNPSMTKILHPAESRTFCHLSLTSDEDDNVTKMWSPQESLLFNEMRTLNEDYDSLLKEPRFFWEENLECCRILGYGGQGHVLLANRVGVDRFRLPVALKFFSPLKYNGKEEYFQAMSHLSQIAMRLSIIQHDNLVDVRNWRAIGEIRVMEMEWIDGYDLDQLLKPVSLERIQKRISYYRWKELNRITVTPGPVFSKVKPGVAIGIMRECLAGLAALHRVGIVHGDIKPANIMLKRTGTAKIIDVNSARAINLSSSIMTYTPRYAAPEVHTAHYFTPQSDLASLGYVLIEMLSGQSPFAQNMTEEELFKIKQDLPNRLKEILPKEVSESSKLLTFCRRLIEPNPDDRFSDAETADLAGDGAADFIRELIQSHLACEYSNEVRLWVNDMSFAETS